MFSGEQITGLLEELGFTHVVGVPDSTIGQWDEALSASKRLRVVRACREGEAWEIAGGLHLGGAQPLVLIQCTGLFESGDALRNVVHDWRLPVYAIVGYRSYHDQSTIPGDTCLVFTEPILDAWKVDYRLIKSASQLDELRQHCRGCRESGRAGVALIAEGKA
jgi:sulfopyruvate decarboxylase subunit alpha